MNMKTPRRTFLQQVALGGAAAQTTCKAASAKPASICSRTRPSPLGAFSAGRHLTAIAFPLGGVCAGSISLGGRGQLRDWEIFNRPDKGNSPSYAFPAIWAQADGAKPVTHVLESRLQPPYMGSSGLGTQNAPGLTRLQSATFTGEFPLARIDFSDSTLPVRVSLEAFSPFIPHDPDNSGLPVAILRYRVTNPGRVAAKVSIAWSVDNPTGRTPATDTRLNEHRSSSHLDGLYMSSPDLPGNDPLKGSFVLAALERGDANFTYSCEAGSATDGGIRLCSTGTISAPMANWAPSPKCAAVSAPSVSRVNSLPARTPITRFSSPGTSPIARLAAAWMDRA